MVSIKKKEEKVLCFPLFPLLLYKQGLLYIIIDDVEEELLKTV